MNAISIPTMFNPRPWKPTFENKRVLRNGRWVSPDPARVKLLRWLKGGDK